MERQEVIRSKIWEEVAEPDNPFAAAACYCHGYDVYGDLLGKASWTEYLYLLFRGSRASPKQVKLLEGLSIAVANLGPRDHAVNAAMNGGAGGSTYASCLMAALAVGAGQLGGAHEVALAMSCWLICGNDLSLWKEHITNPPRGERADIWLPIEHAPGFDHNGVGCSTPVRQALSHLASHSEGGALPWLARYRDALEETAGYPLAMTGVAAATLIDLDFTPEQGEMAYLLLRLPGAAVHALEQEQYGHRQFPFFANGLVLQDDPGPQ